MRLTIQANVKVETEIELNTEELNEVIEQYGSLTEENILEYIKDEYWTEILDNYSQAYVESVSTNEL